MPLKLYQFRRKVAKQNEGLKFGMMCDSSHNVVTEIDYTLFHGEYIVFYAKNFNIAKEEDLIKDKPKVRAWGR